MSHSSLGDSNAHYSVQGETGAGSKVKGNHAQEDESKQTVTSTPPLHVEINTQLTHSIASELSICFAVSSYFHEL